MTHQISRSLVHSFSQSHSHTPTGHETKHPKLFLSGCGSMSQWCRVSPVRLVNRKNKEKKTFQYHVAHAHIKAWNQMQLPIDTAEQAGNKHSGAVVETRVQSTDKSRQIQVSNYEFEQTRAGYIHVILLLLQKKKTRQAKPANHSRRRASFTRNPWHLPMDHHTTPIIDVIRGYDYEQSMDTKGEQKCVLFLPLVSLFLSVRCLNLELH